MKSEAEQGDTAVTQQRSWMGIAVLLLLGLLAVAGVKSYHDLKIVRVREAELEGQIDAARGRLETLAHRLESLESDPLTLERMAREELGMVQEGDVVIVLPEEIPDGETAASAGDASLFERP